MSIGDKPPPKEQKEMLLETIKNKSVVAWEYINLGGTNV
jgi:hypothetical protein